MSDSDTETSESFYRKVKMPKFRTQKMDEIKKLEQCKIFEYIRNMHALLKKYKDKVKKMRKQVNKLKKSQLPMSATENPKEIKIGRTASLLEPKHINKAKCKEEHPKDEQTTSSGSDVVSFVNDIRQAAEQAQNLNGFVYEPTSGLYFDQNTGYYYNAEYGLYYDGSTGCYYNYNQEKNAFEFHSQVEVQSLSKATNDDSDDILENYVSNNEVEFDEWGVITDQKKLLEIKAEKIKTKQEKKERIKRKQRTITAPAIQEYSKKKKHNRDGSRNSNSDASASTNSDSEPSNLRQKRKQNFEDGELSTSSDNDTDATPSGVPIFKKGSFFQDIAKKYPPSLRIIVQETDLANLKVGSLSLITFKGGSLGREGSHDVIIPDLNVSKLHLKFNYNKKTGIYELIDLGSRNGTMLNGIRLSEAKVESSPHDLLHGSVVQIAHTKLLCHVHVGNSTCGLCEPGLLIETLRENAPAATSTAVTLTHKEQLKKLQRKYGLENEKFVDGKQSISGYNDRAATRRVKVGSTTDKEKTQAACVNTAISSENKGFRMLSKLGWSKGEALGKSNGSAGLLEPINVSAYEGKKGLGSDESVVATSLTLADKKKIQTWKKAQERYQKADIFCADSDDSN